ncbi:MAG: hypothetical protein KDK34_24620 [Leptospiraceae bacterium]|nr:hypothetical protein [Leptospiraceae bacterium]
MRLQCRILYSIAALVFTGALVYVGGTMWVLSERWGIKINNGPFETALLHGAYRVANGELLYVDAGAGYIPFIYGPAISVVHALGIKAFGLSMTTARAVSLGISILIVPLLFLIVRELRRHEILRSGRSPALMAQGETGSPASAVFADLLHTFVLTGWMAAGFGFIGIALDTPRVDPLFVISILLQVYLGLLSVRRPESRRLVIALAVVCAAHIFIKQSGLIFFFAMAGVYVLLRRWKTLLLFGCVWIVITGALMAVMEWPEQSRYRVYNFTIPAAHQLKADAGAFRDFIFLEGWTHVAFLIGLIIVLSPFVMRLIRGGDRQTKGRRERINDGIVQWHSFIQKEGYLVLLLTHVFAAAIVSFLGRIKMGGTPNNFWFMHVLLILFAGHVIFQRFANENADEWKMNPATWLRHDGVWRGAMLGSALLFMLMSYAYYDMAGMVRHARYVHANQDRYIESLCALDGDIIDYHSSFSNTILCNGRPDFSYMAAVDIIPYTPQMEKLYADLRQNLEAGTYRRIVVTPDHERAEIETALQMTRQQLEQMSPGPERDRLQSYARALELELLVRSYYQRIAPAEMSAEERTYITLENRFSGLDLSLYRLPGR